MKVLEEERCHQAVGGVNFDEAKVKFGLLNFTSANLGLPTATPAIGPAGQTGVFISYITAQIIGNDVTLNAPVFFRPTVLIPGTGDSVVSLMKSEYNLFPGDPNRRLTIQEFQAIVLLHEFGHSTGALADEGLPGSPNYNQALARQNTLTVLHECFPQLLQ